jgi:predicted RNase H-like nuclease
MRTVLGIDAAWTPTQPSGVALAAQDANGWRLVAAESSYQRFMARSDGGQAPEQRPSGALPDVLGLLSAAMTLSGASVDLAAVDMPLALSPIIGRRASDNAVSRAYGGRKCGTHTPSAQRPGLISDQLREGFQRAGYDLQTTSISPPGVIEVYPHPALLELAGAPERLSYKVSKVRTYWRSVSPAERRIHLYRQWEEIVGLLEGEIAGVRDALPPLAPGAPGWQVKAYEDALDAIVCAWVAMCALEGRATPFGDSDSAIWIPVAADS